MSAEEKKAAEALLKAYQALPTEKREYMLGYAEGVAAMKERTTQPIADTEQAVEEP